MEFRIILRACNSGVALIDFVTDGNFWEWDSFLLPVLLSGDWLCLAFMHYLSSSVLVTFILFVCYFCYQS